MNARQAAREGATLLARAGIEDPDFEAELLAREAAHLDRARFFAGHDLEAAELTRFHELVARRLQREPAAHILGIREFYGLEFEVTPHALVPRPETELLVDLAIRDLAGPPSPPGRGVGGEGAHSVLSPQPSPLVIDVGTGTGCIAIAAALHVRHARIIATDISPAALAVARRNRARHGAPVQFLAGDLATTIGRADIILANLPYIPTDEVRALEPEVRDFEPILALDGGGDGLELIRRLIDDCAARLRPRLLALEVGYGQAASVEAYAKRQAAATELVKDLAGIDRAVCCRWA
jgi:release factor glutamine methyltransferase